uniref:Chemokine (C-C motif) ligand 25a n=1 Tax=Oryzias sinensis TaxID=183150 RepID=A0A8C8DY72_9TELE
MRFHALSLLLILCCVCLAATQVSYDDCCLKYVRKLSRSTQKHAIAYKIQKADGGCNISALVFIMKRGRMICANPNETWAVTLKENLDAKSAKPIPRNSKKPRPLSRKG